MRIAILGAESTGKSTLCHALAASMREAGTDVIVVDEYLREWCATMMRTPQPNEQAAIAHTQTQRIAAVQNATVIADTTALMTAIYSDVLFQDSSLYSTALEDIRRFQRVLVTATDLTWVTDRHFRDSPEMQRAIHHRLQNVLRKYGVTYSMIYGHGDRRLRASIAAVFPSKASSEEESKIYNRWRAQCEKCSDAGCEHRIFHKLTDG